jgi:hypothetical protein
MCSFITQNLRIKHTGNGAARARKSLSAEVGDGARETTALGASDLGLNLLELSSRQPVGYKN